MSSSSSESGDGEMFVCSLCNVACNSSLAFQKHLKGKRHGRKVKAHGGLEASLVEMHKSMAKVKEKIKKRKKRRREDDTPAPKAKKRKGNKHRKLTNKPVIILDEKVDCEGSEIVMQDAQMQDMQNPHLCTLVSCLRGKYNK